MTFFKVFMRHFSFRAADAPATPRKLAHYWQNVLFRDEKGVNQEALFAAGQLDNPGGEVSTETAVQIQSGTLQALMKNQ
ncbi:MAG: hypothetical protein IPJ94_15030 [Chloroflexi bacterium]|nr:hypothetical protein [Chloroflexota bacterium]